MHAPHPRQCLLSQQSNFSVRGPRLNVQYHAWLVVQDISMFSNLLIWASPLPSSVQMEQLVTVLLRSGVQLQALDDSKKKVSAKPNCISCVSDTPTAESPHSYQVGKAGSVG